eukprot:m.207861 g.207861  ORF g.207861 m.207861 type:complete len:1320 (+) comp17124_c0_seq5:4748-8707(+)
MTKVCPWSSKSIRGTPSCRRAAIITLVSSECNKPFNRHSPLPNAAINNTRLEMDLEPGTLTLPTIGPWGTTSTAGLMIRNNNSSVTSSAPRPASPILRKYTRRLTPWEFFLSTAILAKMAVDKKNSHGVKRLVYLRKIGDAGRGAEEVTDELLLRIMSPAVEVVPHGPIVGKVRVPGSKSISNRVLLMAALGKGECRLKGLLHSDDTKVMIAALRQLGVPRIDFEDHGHTLVIQGAGGKLTPAGDQPLFLANAGTAARFLTTACTLTTTGSSIVDGVARMHERPIGDLVTALRNIQCQVECLKTEGYPPLKVSGGGLPGGVIELSANVSSQYVSSILISAPFAKEPVTLKLIGTVVSQPYIDMTLELMKLFGVVVDCQPNNTYVVPCQPYSNPKEFEVEADASSASYPQAMAAITGGRVTVLGVGSASLQGDAAFSRVLAKMGCEVTQDEHQTTVSAPKDGVLEAVDVDMGDITDTFMTAAVLMTTCPKGSVSRITNIANQRVKECNRIEAMIAELGKCGVVCEELEDGLAIHGQGRDLPTALHHGPVSIHCYKDHRIAMSFGVLGCHWPNIIISDKDCTDKTYPAFWDDICNLFVNPDTVRSAVDSDISQYTSALPPSIVIVGMRGAGKSTLGQAAARHLGYKFVDLDTRLEEQCQGGIKDLVAKEGWDAFRDLETSVLAEALKEHPHNTVLACGGGVVERDANVTLLTDTDSVVVWLDRHIADIERYLTADGTRPAYGEGIMDVYQRREPKYAAVSNHRFPLQKGRADWKVVTAQFTRFCGLVTGQERLPLLDRTSFVCLTVPDLTTEPSMASKLADMATEVNAVELRVDLLQDTSPAFIVRQIAFVRAACQLPVIFTVRSVGQGGKFTGDEAAYFELLSLGLRLGCELIDVEACWSEAGAQRFARGAKSQVIGCLHFQRPCSGPEDLAAVANQCSLGGLADVIKAVFTATDPNDNFILHNARQHLADDLAVPTIFMNMGPFGRLSRVLNTCLTPVTHELLANVAAPGQLTALQINSERRSLGLVTKQDFYLFGSPVTLSASPFMHNTGFARLALPHRYHRMDTDDLTTVLSALKQASTGGASLTMPFKEQLLGHLHWISPEARTIGAVNTVVKDGVGRLCGFNTDWEGIVQVMTPFITITSTTRALVLGAGGTARAAVFALQQLGVPSITIWNRTADKATALATKFQVDAEPDLAAACSLPLDIIVCTVAASAQLTLPEGAFANKPVVLDAAYIPKDTAILSQAADHGCTTVPGVEMLIRQGIAQQVLFTQQQPAERSITQLVRREYSAMLARVPQSIRDHPDASELAAEADVTVV